jgi:hypothetical protein
MGFRCVCGHASPQHSFMFNHQSSSLLHAVAIERTAVSPLPFLLGLVKACACVTMHKWLWSRACCAGRGLPCTTMWGVCAVGCLGMFVVHLLRNLFVTMRWYNALEMCVRLGAFLLLLHGCVARHERFD